MVLAVFKELLFVDDLHRGPNRGLHPTGAQLLNRPGKASPVTGRRWLAGPPQKKMTPQRGPPERARRIFRFGTQRLWSLNV